MKIRLKSLLLFLLISIATPLVSQTPITFSGTLNLEGEFVDGTYQDVEIGIYRSTTSKQNILVTQNIFSQVTFSKGQFSVVLTLPPTILNIQNPKIGVRIPQISSALKTYPLTAAPFAQVVETAEQAEVATAGALSGTYLTTFNVSSQQFIVGDDLIYISNSITTKNTVGFGGITQNRAWQLFVSGNVNANDYFINGQSLNSGLLWIQNNNETLSYLDNNTIIIDPINTPPRFNPINALEVYGTVNVTQELLRRGVPLGATLDWISTGNNNQDIYLAGNDVKVGIGLNNPSAKLHIDDSGIRVSGNYSPPLAGMIRKSPSNQQIQGYNGTDFITLTGFKSNGQNGKVAVFENYKSITHDDNFSGNAEGNMGLFTTSNIPINIKQSDVDADLVHIKREDLSPIFTINKDGIVSIGTNNATFDLNVGGTVALNNLFINGNDIRETFSRGDVWLRTPSFNLFYLLEDVGIGQNNPSSMLDIGQRNNTTENVAITFSSGDFAYTMGINSGDADNIFRVESGSTLGSSTPLFVAGQGKFAIGTDTPLYELQISGNRGVVFGGAFFGIPEETDSEIDPLTGQRITPDLPREGPGSRFMWSAQRSLLRIGRISENSPLLGKEWDKENVEKLSVAFGLNNVVSGNTSIIFGGQNNTIEGPFSAIPGGENNQVNGFFSVAIGRNAQANHDGTFVFSNAATPGTAITNDENQFLIYSDRGVGINTNQTTKDFLRTSLTVSRNTTTGNILSFLGNSPTNIAHLTSSGNLNIGTADNGSSKLSVFGNTIFGQPVPNPSGNITELNIALSITNDTNKNHNTLILGDEGVSTPAMVISTGNGHIGMSIYPNMFKDGDTFTSLQVGTGSVLATEYVFPDGTVIAANPLVVFGRNGDDIHYLTGNIGIGTTSPNSLLELSNVGGILFNNRQDTLIEFDQNNTEYFMGIAQSRNNIFRIFATKDATPPLAVSKNTVVIGSETSNASTSLYVPSKSIFTAPLAIGTTNINANDVYAASIYTTGFNLNGEVVEANGTKWNTLSNGIYKPATSLTGIGSNSPNATLEVIGTIKTSAGIVVNNELFVKSSANIRQLNLIEDENSYEMKVTNQKLFIDDIVLSDILTRGLPSAESIGPIILWKDNPTTGIQFNIGESNFIWTSEIPGRTGQLTVSKNIIVGQTNTRSGSSYTQSTDFKIGTTNITTSLQTESTISHDGSLSDSEDFTHKDIQVVIEDTWTTPVSEANFPIKGLDITLKNQNNTNGPSKFTFGSKAYGAYIDVSDVTAQESGEIGSKYAAIMLGNVGVNKFPEPTPLSDYIFDVNGGVSANSFQISQRLSIATINADNILFVNDSSGVAIGTNSTDTALTVSGSIKASHAITGLLSGQSLMAGNSALFAGNNKVGFGTATPESLLHIKKVFNITPSEKVVNLKVSSNLLSNLDAKGIDVTLETAENNTFGNETSQRTAHGIKIDYRGISAKPQGTIIGLKVSANANSETTPAALFLSGNVGINTPTPSALLEIKGTLRAINVERISLLTEQEAASFNRLSISDDNIQLNSVTANIVEVDNLIQNLSQIVINNQVNLPDVALIVTGNTGAMRANTLNLSTTLNTDTLLVNGVATINSATLSDSLQVGTIVSDAELRVANTLTATRIFVTDNIRAGTVSFNNTFYALGASEIGINVINPKRTLHALLKDGTRSYITVQNEDDTIETAAGITFAPGANSNSAGSGIIAVKKSAGNTAVSDMVFLTDPTLTSPNERMRIFNHGGIRIGASNATEATQNQLLVAGTAQFDGTVVFQDQVNILNIISEDTIISNRDLSLTPGTKTIVDDLFQTKQVNLQLSTSFPTATTSPQIFGYTTPEGNSALGFTQIIDGDTITGNIQATFNSQANTIAFHTQSRKLGSSKLFITTSNPTGQIRNEFIINHDNGLALDQENVYLVSSVNNTVNTDQTIQKVNIGFKNRNSTNGGIYRGVMVQIDNSNASTLAEDDTVIGLNVDLTTLEDQSQNFSGGEILQAKKIAAKFLGAGVGIGTATIPTAQLYISERSTINALIVQGYNGTSTEIGISVSNNSFVNIGSLDKADQLAIKQNNANEDIFGIYSTTSNALFVVNKLGNIGINNTNPEYKLSVGGTIKANTATIGTLTGSNLNINNGLVVQNGLVGINQARPQAQFHVFKSVTTNSIDNPFIFQNLSLSVTGADYSKDITGIAYIATSNEYNIFGSNDVTRTYTGSIINMNPIAAVSSLNIVTGIDVTVTGNQIAALFTGGNVGIGDLTPTSALSVVGTIIASGNIDISKSSSHTVSTVNLNTLMVNSRFTVPTFQTQASNHLVVTDTLTAANFTQDFQFINATPTSNPLFIKSNLVSVTSNVNVGLTVLDTTKALTTSGNVVFQHGKVLIDGELEANNAGDIGTDTQLHIKSTGTGDPAFRISKPTTPLISDALMEILEDSRIVFYNNISSVAGLDEANTVFSVGSGDFVNVSSATNTVFSLTSKLNQITNNTYGQLSVGSIPSANNRALVNITQSAPETDIVLIYPKNSKDAKFNVNAAQRTAIGTLANNDVEFLVSGNMHLRNSTAASNIFAVTQNGVLALQTDLGSLESFSLAALPQLLIGSKNVSNVPAVLRNRDNVNGTLFNTGTAYTFMGISSPNVLANNFIIQRNDLDIVFENKNGTTTTEHFRLTNGKLGVGTSTPTASLHIVQNNSTTPLFQVQSNKFIVSANGQIAVNTTNFTADVNIDGTVKAQSIIEAPGGSTWTITTFNIVGESSKSFEHVVNHTRNNRLTTQLINLKVNRDSQQPIIGYDLNIESEGANEIDGSPAYGVYVNMNELSLTDPSFQNRVSNKYAATFRGANVGFGTLTPDALLTVLRTDKDGIQESTGNVFQAVSTGNRIPFDRNEEGSSFEIHNSGITLYNPNQQPLIPADIFRTIAYTLRPGSFFNGSTVYKTNDTKATEILTDLQTDGGTTLLDGNAIRSATSTASLSAAIDAVDSPDGFIVDFVSSKNVYDVLTPFIQEIKFTIKTRHLKFSDTTYNPISLYSGVRPIIPNINGTDQALLEDAFKIAGRVGINVDPATILDNTGRSNFDNRAPSLVVSGDIRVGARLESNQIQSAGEGSRLYFSGGSLLSDAVRDGDNKDVMYISRENVSQGRSDLVIRVGEDHTLRDFAFKIGHVSENATTTEFDNPFVDFFTIKGYSNVVNEEDTFTGIGTSNPIAALHVVGNGSAITNPSNQDIIDYGSQANFMSKLASASITLIENNAANATSLFIRHTADSINGIVGPENNFITFLSSTSDKSITRELGSIEGNGDAGAQLSSSGADYAEYLEKLDPNEAIGPGEVVGVFNGKISKTTEGADRIMVTSVSPIILGNWHNNREKDMVMVAFLGQVSIQTIGQVNKGDYLIPSGKNDGKAIAISPDKLIHYNSDHVVGQAWESQSETTDIGVNAIIGFPLNRKVLGQTIQHRNDIKSTVTELRNELTKKREKYQKAIEKRQEQINQLKMQVRMKGDN